MLQKHSCLQWGYQPQHLRTCPHHRLFRHRAPHACNASSSAQHQETISSVLKSIDMVLGSTDEEPVQIIPEAVDRSPLRVPTWAWGELREPRVVPLASNVLYYLVMLVYTSYYVAQLAQGPEVADDLLARLVNDHAAVASGDALRLFTSFFVSDNLTQLIIALLALATVAAELESLLGYSTFWALWCVTVISGSVADAVLSDIPITAGPAAGVGGIAAALLAHHLHNWRIEQLMNQAKSSEQLPKPLVLLEQQYNQQYDQQQQSKLGQQAAAAGAGQDSAQLIEPSPAPPPPQQQQQQPFLEGVVLHDDELVHTEVDGPAGLPISLKLPKEGQAFASLGGTAVAVLSVLKDAADADVATDWTALAAGFAAGGLLGWLTCPIYMLSLVPASSTKGRNISTAEEADLLLPVLIDSRPLSQRANALIGYAAVLYAVVGVWLWTR